MNVFYYKYNDHPKKVNSYSKKTSMLSKNICGQKLGVISGYNNGSPLSETAVLFADNSLNYLAFGVGGEGGTVFICNPLM